MMDSKSDAELREFAGCIYKLTRREIWEGGKTILEHDRRVRPNKTLSPGWPEELPRKWSTYGITWTLSPEVQLGEHRMRVCVSWDGNTKDHRIDVYVDDQLKYPGGTYTHHDKDFGIWWLLLWLVGPSWSTRIARLEHRDGGQTGPIERRDLLIAEAKSRLGSPKIAHKETERALSVEEPEPECKDRRAALAEVDAITKITL